MEGRTLSHYRVLEEVGAGGMGVVYRARDERLERDVALKVLPRGSLSEEGARRRFRKEALTLSRLNHPHIATIYDFDSREGVDFLVMEYISGQTLTERLAGGPLPEKEIAALGTQIASALEEAHSQQVLHCDLKPGNIMVTSRGQAKVLDFGLAKLLPQAEESSRAETTSELHVAAGTLPYMSPEQLRDESPDVRSDVYSAGASSAGRKNEAQRLLGHAIRHPEKKRFQVEAVAAVYTALGDKDRAFVWLEKAYAAHSPSLPGFLVYPLFDPLRSDPRFKDLLRRVGLPADYPEHLNAPP